MEENVILEALKNNAEEYAMEYIRKQYVDVHSPEAEGEFVTITGDYMAGVKDTLTHIFNNYHILEKKEVGEDNSDNTEERRQIGWGITWFQ